MSCACDIEKCFCWNGREDELHDCIDRSKFVTDIRKKLAKKKIKRSSSIRILLNFSNFKNQSRTFQLAEQTLLQ